MDHNTTRRSSANNAYDTATEESISLYYSFNDKTLEADGSFNNSTVDQQECDNIKTVVKRRSSSTPLKPIPRRVSQLQGFSSTPSKINFKQGEFVDVGVYVLDDSGEVLPDNSSNDVIFVGPESTDTDTKKSVKNEIVDEVIQESTNENSGDSGTTDSGTTIEISDSTPILEDLTKSADMENKTEINVSEVISDNVEIIETNEIEITTEECHEQVFQIIENITNTMQTITIENESIEKNILIEQNISTNVNEILRENNTLINKTDEINDILSEDSRENDDIKNLNSRNSLADKMVDEIKTLIKKSVNRQINREDKENLGCNKSDKGNKQTLSPIKNRKSLLAKPTRVSIKSNKTIKPSEPDLTNNKPSRIIQNKRTSILPPSSMPAIRDDNRMKWVSKVSVNPIKEVLEPSSRKAVRMNMIPEVRQQASIDKRKTIFTIPSKRYSTIKPTKSVDIPQGNPIKVGKASYIMKTTLLSPTVNRKSARRTIDPVKIKPSSRKSVLPTTSTRLLTNPTQMKPPAAVPAEREPPQRMKSITSFKAKPFPHDEFICGICSRMFRVHSMYDAHIRSHGRSATNNDNQCKYCDKKFAIYKALDKHLKEFCPKISAAERRLLLTSPRLERIEKSTRTNTNLNTSNQLGSISSTESLSVVTKIKQNLHSMQPPSSSKVKKTTPHSGVFRTPNKGVACTPCNKMFDNILSFSEHMLSHSSSD